MFGAVTAVDRIILILHEGEFFSLLGLSGCGTTSLRLIAGFEIPTSGDILIGEEPQALDDTLIHNPLRCAPVND